MVLRLRGDGGLARLTGDGIRLENVDRATEWDLSRDNGPESGFLGDSLKSRPGIEHEQANVKIHPGPLAGRICEQVSIGPFMRVHRLGKRECDRFSFQRCVDWF